MPFIQFRIILKNANLTNYAKIFKTKMCISYVCIQSICLFAQSIIKDDLNDTFCGFWFDNVQ